VRLPGVEKIADEDRDRRAGQNFAEDVTIQQMNRLAAGENSKWTGCALAVCYKAETNPFREILAKKGGIFRLATRDTFGRAFTNASAISCAFISLLPNMNTRTLCRRYASSAAGR